MHYVVELEKGVWIAPWEGDPGRTLVIENAKYFETEKNARHALGSIISRYRYFRNAEIYPFDASEIIEARMVRNAIIDTIWSIDEALDSDPDNKNLLNEQLLTERDAACKKLDHLRETEKVTG